MAKIRSVLVVDNNATIVELIAGHLAAAGYQVAKAYDGLQALDRLADTDQLPDVILLDLIMPRLDGEWLTGFLKQDPVYRSIPIVILSGIASEDSGTILAFGADAYIAKGRIEDTMAHVFETFRWLEGRAAPDERRSVVLGIEKLYPREMTRELLHIKGHLNTSLDFTRREWFNHLPVISFFSFRSLAFARENGVNPLQARYCERNERRQRVLG